MAAHSQCARRALEETAASVYLHRAHRSAQTGWGFPACGFCRWNMKKKKQFAAPTETLVGGVDLANTTPISDIKPYLPFSDCCRDAKPGYTALTQTHSLAVHCPPQLLQKMPPQRAEALLQVLRQDPRPGYKTEDEAQYGFRYAGNEIKFTVKDGVLTVLQID